MGQTLMTMLEVSQVEKFIEELKEIVKNCDSIEYFAFAQVQNDFNVHLLCDYLETKYLVYRFGSTAYCSLEHGKTLQLKFTTVDSIRTGYHTICGMEFNFALISEEIDSELTTYLQSRVRRNPCGIWTYNANEEIRNAT